MENQREPILVVTEGPNKGERFLLAGLICTIGRSSDNTIMLNSPQISRHHAQIRLLPTGAVIEDLGSTNGTWVNGRHLTQPHRLTTGDTISLAEYITFKYVLDEERKPERGEPRPPFARREIVAGGREYEAPARPRPQSPASEHDEPPARPGREVVSSTAEPQPDIERAGKAAPAHRPTALYVLMGILIALIGLCVAATVFLWFAPESFWQRIFELVNIPSPSGTFLRGAFLALR